MGRPTCTDTCTLAAFWSGRPDGRPTESRFALGLFGSTGRSTASANGSKFDRWAVDRAVDRQGNSGKNYSQRLVSRFAYKYPICKSFSLRFLVRIFPYSLVFLLQLKEVFELELNNPFGVFIRVWKIKERVFGKGFWLNFSILVSVFPKDFLWFWFPFHWFSPHLS